MKKKYIPAYDYHLEPAKDPDIQLVLSKPEFIKWRVKCEEKYGLKGDNFWVAFFHGLFNVDFGKPYSKGMIKMIRRCLPKRPKRRRDDKSLQQMIIWAEFWKLMEEGETKKPFTRIARKLGLDSQVVEKSVKKIFPLVFGKQFDPKKFWSHWRPEGKEIKQDRLAKEVIKMAKDGRSQSEIAEFLKKWDHEDMQSNIPSRGGDEKFRLIKKGGR